jgi:hypothetical protein
MFTKSQLGRWGGYWALPISGNCCTYFDLRSRGIIGPKSDKKSQQRKTVMRAYSTIVEVINALKPEDYTEIARYSASKQSKTG